MTYSKAIEELAIAIAYALDAANTDRPLEYRRHAKDSAEKILVKVMSSRPFELDPIIISEDDVKARRPVRIDTNR